MKELSNISYRFFMLIKYLRHLQIVYEIFFKYFCTFHLPVFVVKDAFYLTTRHFVVKQLHSVFT